MKKVFNFSGGLTSAYNATAANRSGLYPAPMYYQKYLHRHFIAFVVTKLQQKTDKNVIMARYFIR